MHCILRLTKFGAVAAASWRKRLDARLPSLGSRVRLSVTPCGFRGGRNGVWVSFSRGFSRFPLPQISFHHFSTLISSISFHFIRPCDGASGVVGRHPCYSRTYNMGHHRISSLDPTTNFIPPFLHTHLIHFVSFHFISSCDGRPASLLFTDFQYTGFIAFIPRPGHVSDNS